MLKGWPKLSWHQLGRWAQMVKGLKVPRVLPVNISLVGEDWGAGYRLHVNGGILGLFVPKRGIVFLILRNKRNPEDIHKWHASITMYSTQKGLNFVKYLCGGGGV
jgi:hypothetical protein